MSAAEDMQAALLRLLDHDETPPCVKADAPDPISEDPDEREASTYRCTRCPIRRECGAFGDEIKATHGVYGGTDRSRAPGRPRKDRTAA